MTERRAKGEQVDKKSIKKHSNDVLRLMVLLQPDITVKLPQSISDDMRKFLEMVENSEKFVRVAEAYRLADAI